VSISGHVLDTIGLAYINIAGQHARVIAVDNLEPKLLIGADFLRHCVLDFPGKICVVGNNKYSMNISHEHCFRSFDVSHFIPKTSFEVIKKVLDSYLDLLSQTDNPV